MRKEARLEEWRKLYDVAIKIKAMTPWDYMGLMDVITIDYPGMERCVCSYYVDYEGHLSVNAYFGDRAIRDYYFLAQNNIQVGQRVKYNDCYSMKLGIRRNIKPAEMKVIRGLGLKFRGTNNWIYFHRLDPGFMPYMMDRQEVVKFTCIMEQLYEAMKAMEEGFKVDFKNGKTLLRTFDKETDQWYNKEMDRYNPVVPVVIPKVRDKKYMKRLLTRERKDVVLEVDVAYMNIYFQKQKSFKPVLPKLLMVANHETGAVLRHETIDPSIPGSDDPNMLLEAVTQHTSICGTPKKVIVRDPFQKEMLSEICEKLDIELDIAVKLPWVDKYIYDLPF